MTQAIATRENQGMAVPSVTLDDIRRYICPDATEQEAFMFLKLCESQGLNPFVRDAYLVIYVGANGKRNVSMITGKDTFTKRAEAQPEFRGFRAGVIVSRKDAIVELDGTFFLDTDKLLGGWAEIHRSDRSIPFKVTVRMSEYNPDNPTWRKMPGTMIRKVALVQALREAFPSAFRGLYDASEMGVEPSTLPEATVVRGESSGETVQGVPEQMPILASPQQLKAVFASAREHGWSNDDIRHHVDTTYAVQSSKDLTRAQASELIQYIAEGKRPAVALVAAEQLELA